MISTTGLSLVRGLLLDGTSNHITHTAMGSGTTIPTIDDSGLEYEISTRATISHTALGSPLVGDTYTAVWNSVEASGIGSISEIGLFSQSIGGSMFCRASFDQNSLTGGSEYKMEWNIQIV